MLAELESDITPERSGTVEVQLSPTSPLPLAVTEGRLTSLPFVLLGVTTGAVDSRWLDTCDVVVDASDPALDLIRANVDQHPITAATLALLLRGQHRLSVGDGLVAESSAYSVLQAGPEFAAWRVAHPARNGATEEDDSARVRLERSGGVLVVTLTRPSRLNALDARMRDELVEALTVAAADPTVTTVELRGEGRAFCSGGDLDEFGSRSDPASAHLIRLERSVARALSRLAKETVAYVHGATVGSGVEMAAFSDRVVASVDTQIALPEIELGLVPGAGGTVSLPRRIGRLRTAWLAFSAATIDASQALEWGLVDAVEG